MIGRAATREAAADMLRDTPRRCSAACSFDIDQQLPGLGADAWLRFLERSINWPTHRPSVRGSA
jgi:hypothetical protein